MLVHWNLRVTGASTLTPHGSNAKHWGCLQWAVLQGWSSYLLQWVCHNLLPNSAISQRVEIPPHYSQLITILIVLYIVLYSRRELHSFNEEKHGLVVKKVHASACALLLLPPPWHRMTRMKFSFATEPAWPWQITEYNSSNTITWFNQYFAGCLSSMGVLLSQLITVLWLLERGATHLKCKWLFLC